MTTPKFSKREKDVIHYLLEGGSNKQIAQKMDVSIRTVEFHLSNIYARLDTRSRTEAVIKLTKMSLRKPTGENTSKVLRTSTVAKKGIQVENGVNQLIRRFIMKNLMIGITVGVSVTLLLIFAISSTTKISKRSGGPIPLPTTTSESSTPAPFGTPVQIP